MSPSLKTQCHSEVPKRLNALLIVADRVLRLAFLNLELLTTCYRTKPFSSFLVLQRNRAPQALFKSTRGSVALCGSSILSTSGSKHAFRQRLPRSIALLCRGS